MSSPILKGVVTAIPLVHSLWIFLEGKNNSTECRDTGVPVISAISTDQAAGPDDIPLNSIHRCSQLQPTDSATAPQFHACYPSPSSPPKDREESSSATLIEAYTGAMESVQPGNNFI